MGAHNLIFFQIRLGHITSAKVCKDKALLICIIIIIITFAPMNLILVMELIIMSANVLLNIY